MDEQEGGLTEIKKLRTSRYGSVWMLEDILIGKATLPSSWGTNIHRHGRVLRGGQTLQEWSDRERTKECDRGSRSWGSRVCAAIHPQSPLLILLHWKLYTYGQICGAV